MLKKILTLFYLFVLIFLNAQHENAVWFASQLPVKLSEKLELHNDIGVRMKGDKLEVNQILFRTGLRFYLNKNFNTAAGIAWFLTDQNLRSKQKKFGTEFRFWEEFVFQKNFNKKIKNILRLRTEQRYFDEYENKNSYAAFRMRFLVQMIKKFNDNWSLQLGNEYFYQMKSENSAFDQDRITGNVIYNLKNDLELKVGLIEIILPNKKYTDTFVLGINKKL